MKCTTYMCAYIMHAQKNLQKTQQAAGTEFVDALTKVSRQLRTVFNARVAAHGTLIKPYWKN